MFKSSTRTSVKSAFLWAWQPVNIVWNLVLVFSTKKWNLTDNCLQCFKSLNLTVFGRFKNQWISAIFLCVKNVPHTVLPLTSIYLKQFSGFYRWEATLENANPKGLKPERWLKAVWHLLLFLNLMIFVIWLPGETFGFLHLLHREQIKKQSAAIYRTSSQLIASL